MRAREFVDTRIRVEKRENHELYFIPEVLILNTEITWEDDDMLRRIVGGHGQEYVAARELYTKIFAKTIEWCPIKKSRSIYSDGIISLDKVQHRIDYNNKVGFKTLKGAKGVIDAFRQKHKDHF